MLDEQRTSAIEGAITAQEAAGQPWTNQSIYDVVGGNYGELSQYLKARRAQTRRPGRGGGTATALAEEAVLAETPAILQEQLDATRLAYSHASGRLAQLRSQSDSLLLSEAEETEMLRLERRIERLQPVLERLAKEVAEEREAVDVEAFRATWLPLVEGKRQAYEALVARQRELWLALMTLEQHHLAQEQAIDTLPPRLARRLHDLFLPDFNTLKKRLVVPMHNAQAWDLLLCAAGPPRLTPAVAVMDADPGTKALPPRLLPNILEGRV